MKYRTAICCILSSLAGPVFAADAVAMLKGPDGTDMGQVTFTATEHGVLISADASGLEPGGHGFHIHETGSCEPAFDAAGGHYNPDERGHGFTAEGGHHAGDMPNIFAGSDGMARADVINAAVSLEEGDEATLFDDDGSAIIIHEKPDSYGEDAMAGGRVACGVIEKN